jgi:hypothetical protein
MDFKPFNPSNDFEVRDPVGEALIKKIGDELRAELPPGDEWGFALWLFHEEDLFYTSNCKREEVIKAMQSFIAKFREH